MWWHIVEFAFHIIYGVPGSGKNALGINGTLMNYIYLRNKVLTQVLTSSLKLGGWGGGGG